MIQSFYLLKPKIITADIYYKIFVTDDRIYFIQIGGQFHSQHAYETQLPFVVEILFSSWFKKVMKNQVNVETEIDAKIHTGDVHELLQQKNNFSIPTSTIEEITLSKEGTFHTGFNDNGTALFMLKNGEKRKFIIPKTNSLLAIKEILNRHSHTILIKETW